MSKKIPVINKQKIIPRLDWVLVLPVEPEKTTSNGLIMPSNVDQEQKSYGNVVEIGEEVKGLKKGDLVVFGVFAGERVQLTKSEKEYRLLKNEDVIALIV